MNTQPTGIEAEVCEMIAARQQLGIAKYGMTVADNPLALRDWLQHALEETLDQAVYLKRAISELDKHPVLFTLSADKDDNVLRLTSIDKDVLANLRLVPMDDVMVMRVAK